MEASSADPTQQTNELGSGARIHKSVQVPRETTGNPSVSTVYIVPTSAERMDIVTVSQQDPDSEIVPTTCACIGLAFSWLPLVGLFNFVLNLGAPAGSVRKLLGTLSCVVASIVFLFWIIFLPLYWYA